MLVSPGHTNRAVRDLRRTRIGIRCVAALFVVIAILTFAGALGVVVESLMSPETSLATWPRHMPPSRNLLMRNAYRFEFAGAVYQLVLAPLFIVGGVQLFRLRDFGRRLLAWGLGLQIVIMGVMAVGYGVFLVGSIADPGLYPAAIASAGLVIVAVWGLILGAIFALLRSDRFRAACAANALETSPAGGDHGG